MPFRSISARAKARVESTTHLRSTDWLALAALCIIHFIYLRATLLGRAGPADDQVWFVPTVYNATKDLSPLAALWRLLSPDNGEWTAPAYGIFTYLCLKLFGFSNYPMSLVLLVVHYVNTLVLVLLISTRLRLGRASAFVAGVLYLFYFGHYHAYYWPEAVQHLSLMAGYLIFAYLYLLVEERAVGQAPAPRAAYFTALLVAGLLSLTKISVMLLPLGIICHLGFIYHRDPAGLRRAFRRWAPALFLIGFYQGLTIVTGGAGFIFQSSLGVNHGAVGLYRKLAYVAAVVLAYPLSHLLVRYFRFAWAPFLIALICLVATLKIYHGPVVRGGLALAILALLVSGRRYERACLALMALFILICRGPFFFGVATMALVYPPALLRAPATSTLRWSPLFWHGVSGLGAILWVIVLVSVLRWLYRRDDRATALFYPLIAFACLLFVNPQADQPSRYYTYLSVPLVAVFSVFLCEVLHWRGAGRWLWNGMRVAFIIAVVGLSLGAINFHRAQMKFSSFGWTYDCERLLTYLRAKLANPEGLCVSDAPITGEARDLVFTAYDEWNNDPVFKPLFAPVVPYLSRIDLFKGVLAAEYHLKAPPNIRVGECGAWPAPLHTVSATENDLRLDGESLDPFYARLNSARAALKIGERPAFFYAPTVADDLGEAAAPFFVRFMFDEIPLSDLACLTGGRSLVDYLTHTAFVNAQSRILSEVRDTAGVVLERGFLQSRPLTAEERSLLQSLDDFTGLKRLAVELGPGRADYLQENLTDEPRLNCPTRAVLAQMVRWPRDGRGLEPR